MEIQALGQEHGQALYDLWLDGTAEYPEAFGATPEEFRATAPLDFAQRQLAASERFVIFGALREGELHGFLAIGRDLRVKLRHSMLIGPVYVRPERRRSGLGAALLGHAVDHARQLGDVQVLKLAVAEGNRAARSVYEACGFRVYGMEPKGMHIEGTWHAMALYALELC